MRVACNRSLALFARGKDGGQQGAPASVAVALNIRYRVFVIIVVASRAAEFAAAIILVVLRLGTVGESACGTCQFRPRLFGPREGVSTFS